MKRFLDNFPLNIWLTAIFFIAVSKHSRSVFQRIFVKTFLYLNMVRTLFVITTGPCDSIKISVQVIPVTTWSDPDCKTILHS